MGLPPPPTKQQQNVQRGLPQRNTTWALRRASPSLRSPGLGSRSTVTPPRCCMKPTSRATPAPPAPLADCPLHCTACLALMGRVVVRLARARACPRRSPCPLSCACGGGGAEAPRRRDRMAMLGNGQRPNAAVWSCMRWGTSLHDTPRGYPRGVRGYPWGVRG